MLFSDSYYAFSACLSGQTAGEKTCRLFLRTTVISGNTRTWLSSNNTNIRFRPASRWRKVCWNPEPDKVTWHAGRTIISESNAMTGRGNVFTIMMTGGGVFPQIQ